LTQSAVLLVVILFASRFVGHIPLAALAGVLLATVVQMVEVANLRSILRSTRGDAVVLVSTAIATIVLDLVTAVIIGLVVAALYALRQVAKSAHVDAVPLDLTDHSDEEQRLLNEHVVAYRLDGSLFFGAAHSFLLEVSQISDVHVVILRLSRIQTLDATGARVLGNTIKTLEGRGITVMLSGIQPDHENVFRALGVYDHLAHAKHIFADTPAAIAHARTHVHSARDHVHPAYGPQTA
jgi:MFS superfamily sulfate permease-like transporter